MAETAIRGGVAAAVPHDSAAQARLRRSHLYRRSAGAGGHAARRGRPQHSRPRRDRGHGSGEGARGAGRGRGGRRQGRAGGQRRRSGISGRSAVRRRYGRICRSGPVRGRCDDGRAGSARRAPGRGRIPRARGDPERRGRARPSSPSCCRPTRCGAATPTQSLAKAPHRLTGRIRIGGQDHFYLEGQVVARYAGRGRRHAGVELDPASERSAASGRQGAGHCRTTRSRSRCGAWAAASAARRRRPRRSPAWPRCSRTARGDRSSSGSIATTTCCSPASGTTS